MNPRLLLLLALISAAATIGKTHAATRIALVGTGISVENVLDAATALLSKDTDLQLLDRAAVGRVLREQEISLAGLVRAVRVLVCVATDPSFLSGWMGRIGQGASLVL